VVKPGTAAVKEDFFSCLLKEKNNKSIKIIKNK
jgi:hypothetical protein